MNLQLHEWLSLFGLALGSSGAWYTAASPVLKKEDAIKIGTAKWVDDDDVKRQEDLTPLRHQN